MVEIEEFDFEIEHHPGIKHSNTDAMSWKPCRQCVFCKEDIAGMPLPYQQTDSEDACAMLRLDLDAWSADQVTEQQARDPKRPSSTAGSWLR